MAEDLVSPRQLSGRSIGTSLVLLIHLATTMTTDALWLSVPDSGTKCVAEEIHSNNVVLGDYTVIYGDRAYQNPTVSVKVTSPYGHTLHHQENVTTGHFAFTTKESGSYLACFWLDGHHQNVDASVNLELRTGIGAKDWDTVAKKEKLEGVELELRKLQALVESIHLNLLHLKSKEAEMREVSERTNTRVAWYSIMALGVCILVSALQLWHLKGCQWLKLLLYADCCFLTVKNVHISKISYQTS